MPTAFSEHQVLLIEDDPDIIRLVQQDLAASQYRITDTGNAENAIAILKEQKIDAIILDLGLLGKNGLELCREIRTEIDSQLPIIILTSWQRLEDKLRGFEAGADDYVTKPFSPKELEVRLDALMRRVSRDTGRVLKVEELELDLDKMSVTREGKPLHLTANCLRSLTLLMKESHRVVTRREVERAIWGDNPPDSDALRVHIHTLRKIIDKPFDQPLLHTIHGIGYRIGQNRFDRESED